MAQRNPRGVRSEEVGEEGEEGGAPTSTKNLLELPIPLTCSGIFTVTGPLLWQTMREGCNGFMVCVCVCVCLGQGGWTFLIGITSVISSGNSCVWDPLSVGQGLGRGLWNPGCVRNKQEIAKMPANE